VQVAGAEMGSSEPTIRPAVNPYLVGL